ncbi:MAG: hypothetical protein AAFO99_11805 [Bacteroidota bacterium]
MKTYKKINIFLMSLTAILMIAACETDFENPNSASSDEVFTSREGLLSASIGLSQRYSTSGIRFTTEAPAITTREVAITSTFQNLVELEDGGSMLPNFNSNTVGMWSNLLRIMGVAEDIAENAPNVDLDPGTTSGIIAYANVFRALSIGNLSQNFEQVIIQTSPNNDATFVSREAGFQEAIRLLEEANSVLSANPISTEFESAILQGNISLPNVINVLLSRYNLFLGNYDAAIATANTVDLSIPSEFIYDTQNPNPIWSRVFQNDVFNFRPQDNFGIPVSLNFDPADGRLAFYHTPLDTTSINGFPVEDLAGFFQGDTDPIPVYLPDEVRLIIAEAQLRKSSPDMAAALAQINEVRTDTDDLFGVNANLAPYTGPMTVEALLDEVFVNRRAELFLTGTSLEDSRRFGRPQPNPAPQTFTDERNRNFYPYPDTERNNNPNTPADPAI